MAGEELTPEEIFAAEDASKLVPRALKKGRTHEDIVAELMRHGWSPAAARQFVSTTAEDLRRIEESPEARSELLQHARRQIAIGLFISLLGVAFTVLTILGALGGYLPFYVVTYGLILFGLVVAARGLARWRVCRDESTERK